MLYCGQQSRDSDKKLWGQVSMGHPIKVTAIALLAALSFSKTGVAAPIVSVDMDPTTAGVQSSVTVQQGEIFSVDIFISGVEATSPLNTFNLTLSGYRALVTALSASLGPFLPSPNVSIGPFFAGSFARIGGLGLGPTAAASGDGILASISFSADVVGTSGLQLSNVELSQPFGIAITDFSLLNGSVTIESGPSQLSAPPALALLLLGGLATWVAARRRTDQQLS